MKSNIATSLINLFASADGLVDRPSADQGRYRQNRAARLARKEKFADDMAAEYLPPKHIKLARKAALGEVGIRRRGLMVRRINGKLVIVA